MAGFESHGNRLAASEPDERQEPRGWPGSLVQRSLKRIVLLLAALAILTSFGSQVAHAQSAGVLGWKWGTSYYPTAREACYAMWLDSSTSSAPRARFIGAIPKATDPFSQTCSWTSFQYLCPEETAGQPGGCGTGLPASVGFSCATGYRAIAGPLCIKVEDLAPERCGPCEAGKPHPAKGNPIALDTGSKIIRAMDFETDDGRLTVSRSFRSKVNGLHSAGDEVGQAPTRGLGGHWNLDFLHELHLGAFSGSPGGTLGYVAWVDPRGIAYRFRLQADGSWRPGDSRDYYDSNSYKLQFVGLYPASLSTIRTTQTKWKLTDPADTVWEISTGPSYLIGRPTSRTDRDGYRWDFTYDSDGALEKITDSYGRQLLFKWRKFHVSLLATPPADAKPIAEAIKSITLPDGTSLRYSYDIADNPGADPVTGIITPSTDFAKRLVKVERLTAGGTVIDLTTYLYEDAIFPNFVTGVLNKNGVRTATYAYDPASARAISTKEGGGANAYQVSYARGAAGNILATATNALGKAETYTFERSGATYPYQYRLTTIDGAATINTPDTLRSFTYMATPGPFLMTDSDELGRVTNYTRDAEGRPLTVTEADGTPLARTTTYAYHTSLNRPAIIVRDGLREAHAYTSRRLSSLTQLDTTAITVPYATINRTRRWSYTWSTTGQPLTIDGPLAGTADTVTMTYGTIGTMNGQLATVTNEVGHVTQVLSRNALGQPLTVQDANGVQTVMTYNLLGRLATVTVDPGTSQSKYTMLYDAAGNVTRLTLPMGGWITYTYDAASRLTRISNDRGQSQTFTLNALGGVTAAVTKDAAGIVMRQSTNAYDELGRLIAATGGGGATWNYAYDAHGNLASTTDGRGKLWSSAVDEHDRTATATDPELAVQTYAYEASDELAQFRDGRGIATDRVVDGFGRVIRETGPDTGTTDYWYDLADNPTRVTDANGRSADYTYDAAGRMLTEVRSGGGAATQTIAYSYDSVTGGNKGVGRLTGVTDPSGSSAFVYDAQGRVVRDTRVIGTQSYALAFSYDANGAVTSITYPSGRVVVYNRAVDGLVASVQGKASAAAAAVNHATAVTYKPFGPLASLTYGNGLVLTRTYDRDYWLSGITVAGVAGTVLGVSYTRDGNGNVTAITDSANAARNASYGYSDANRLASATGIWGADSYGFDANGNRTLASREASGVTASDVATLPAASNRLAEIRDAGGVLAKAYGYDAAGAIVSRTDAGGSVWTYGYDAGGRLATVTQDGAARVVNAHDFAGRRVSRLDPAAGTLVHVVYDAAGRPLAEYDGTKGAAAPIREYVWLDDTLIATVHGTLASPFHRYITAGPLGDALLETRPDGTVSASLTRDPWGNVIALAGGTRLPTGFDGQLADAASGLYQNWHRNYDPSLGRYIEPDPIGLGGGPNRYAYVGGNPMAFTDPMGLATAGAAAGAAFGGAIGSRAGPVGRRIGIAIGGRARSAVEDLIRKCFEDDDPDEDGPCEIQKRDDELECNQWHITGGKDGYTRKQGFVACMRTAMIRYSECRSRAMDPARISTPLFLPTGRRGGPDRSRSRSWR